MSVAEISPAPQGLYEVVENPCGISHRGPDEPLWMSVLNFSILAIGCVISGALAARITGERRLAVAFLAPFLGYVVLLFLGGPHWLALVVGLFAGLLGMVGVGWRYLTNAWSATRSKQRAPQA
jgi:MFS family permease